MDKLLLLGMNGLIWGLIIALIALGLAIIFGLLDIINLAHGDFFMVGTVLAWATLQSTGSFWLAFIVAPLIGLILGATINASQKLPVDWSVAQARDRKSTRLNSRHRCISYAV